MSYPNVPNVTPEIKISREDVVNLLLASIAFEELGLSHLINAEAEKLQAVLGTLTCRDRDSCIDVPEFLVIDKSLQSTLGSMAEKEMILLMKLEEVKSLSPEHHVAPGPESH